MPRLTDLRLKLVWTLGVLALLAAGVLVHRLTGPPLDGKVALDFLAAIERADYDAVASLVVRDAGDPDPRHVTPPSTPWHPVGVLDITVTDEPDDYDVTVEVAPLGGIPTRVVLSVTAVDGEPRVAFPWQRAAVTVADGPMDVSFAGTPHPGAVAFGEYVLPGVYLVTGVRESGGDSEELLVVPAPDGTIPTLTLPAA